MITNKTHTSKTKQTKAGKTQQTKQNNTHIIHVYDKTNKQIINNRPHTQQKRHHTI